MSTWKSLKKSLSWALPTPQDITSMEVRTPSARIIKLKSSSTLLNVDLTNCNAYITNAKPPAPPSAIAYEKILTLSQNSTVSSALTSNTLPSTMSTAHYVSAATSVSTLLVDQPDNTHAANCSLIVQPPDPVPSTDNDSFQMAGKKYRRSLYRSMGDYCRNVRSLVARISLQPRTAKDGGSINSRNSHDSSDSIDTLAREYLEFLAASNEFLDYDISFGAFFYMWETPSSTSFNAGEKTPTCYRQSPKLCTVPNSKMPASNPKKVNAFGKMRSSHVHRKLARRFSLATKEVRFWVVTSTNFFLISSALAIKHSPG